VVAAARSGVPKSLAAEASGTPPSALRARLVQKLIDEHALTGESAAWAVDSWMLALGMQPPDALQTETQPQKQSQVGTAIGALFLVAAIAGGVWLWQSTRRGDTVDEHVVGSWTVDQKTSTSGSLVDRMNDFLPHCSMDIKADGAFSLNNYCGSFAFSSGKITIRDGQWQMRSDNGRTLSGTYTVAGPFLTMSSSDPTMPQHWLHIPDAR